MTENRISLDTGAYYSDRLSAVVIDEASGERRFFVAGPENFAPIEPNRLDRGFGTLLDVIDIKAR